MERKTNLLFFLLVAINTRRLWSNFCYFVMCLLPSFDRNAMSNCEHVMEETETKDSNEKALLFRDLW